MAEEAHEYTDTFVAGLEQMWGEGFLSPGGPKEIAEILRGFSLNGAHVLDIGCGLGGIDCLLVAEHGAAHVVGIDIEPPLVERAAERVARRGLSEQIAIRLVEPGPLDFPDASFDVVFTKDSIIHVEDKLSIYREIHRVLKPGGHFVGGDWLRGSNPDSVSLKGWLLAVGLEFGMSDFAATRAALENAGFTSIELNDRNSWYQTEVVKETQRLVEGEGRAMLDKAMGEEAARQRIQSNELRRAAVEAGDLRPTHFRAEKG